MASEHPQDIEGLLRSALRPIEPPEKLSGRLEETLNAVTEAAAEELSAWAEELSESELRSLRDPRNWVRPAAAIAAGGIAAGGLLLVELRRRGSKRPSRFSGLPDQVQDVVLVVDRHQLDQRVVLGDEADPAVAGGDETQDAEDDVEDAHEQGGRPRRGARGDQQDGADPGVDHVVPAVHRQDPERLLGPYRISGGE